MLIKKIVYHVFAAFHSRSDFMEFIPKLQSHRGYCQPHTGVVENTLKAVIKSYELDYQMVEFDVRMTKDKQVVLFHDEVIAHTKIAKLTLLDLKKIRHVDLLSDVFEWHQKTKTNKFKLNIEIKSKAINGILEKNIYELICKYKMQKKIIISSFNPMSLAYMNTFDPTIFRSLLLSNEKGYGNNFFIKNMTLNFLARPNALHLRDRDWNQKIFSKFLEKKIPIVLWTCNDLAAVETYFKEGVTGVISDKIKPSDLPG